MYDKLNQIICDGIEYYYNTGQYIFVFDPTEGGMIWVYKIVGDDWENCHNIKFKILDEFIKFASFIKNLEKSRSNRG